MKKEQALDLMTAIDPGLIEEADLPMPSRRRLPKLVRAGLIAACLCLALAGTAAAAVAMGWIKATDPSVIQLPHRDRGTVTITQYEVAMDGSVYIPLENISQEALDYANSFLSLPQYKNFDSWEEAEEFLGVRLASNPVLDKAELVTQPPQSDLVNTDQLPGVAAPARGNKEATKCEIRFEGRTDSPSRISLRSVYRLEAQEGRPINIGVSADIHTAPSPWGQWGQQYQYVDKEVSVENYVTPNGLQTVIVATHETANDPEYPEHDYTFYEVQFSLHGAYYRLTSFCFLDEGGTQAALSLIKEVLDAFQ